MKVSYAHWKFQWKFHQTFIKLSHAYFLASKNVDFHQKITSKQNKLDIFWKITKNLQKHGPSMDSNWYNWLKHTQKFIAHIIICRNLFFPTSQVRVVRFYHSCSSPPSPLPPPRQSSSPTSSPILIAKLLANPLRQLLIAVGTAGPQLPASDRSGHPWTSTASVSSQWASLDLNRQRRIPVGTPGPQPPASDQWAPLDPNDQILSPNIITKHHHKTSSQSIITIHHHKTSSQTIFTNHYHRPSSQNIITIHHHKASSQIIITDHFHKTSSQYIITKHHHKSLSHIIFTKHHRNTSSQNMITKHYHKTSSQSIFTKHHHNTSSQNIITDHLHKSLSQTIFTKHHHNTSSQNIITDHLHKSLSQTIFTKHHHNTSSSCNYQAHEWPSSGAEVSQEAHWQTKKHTVLKLLEVVKCCHVSLQNNITKQF